MISERDSLCSSLFVVGEVFSDIKCAARAGRKICVIKQFAFARKSFLCSWLCVNNILVLIFFALQLSFSFFSSTKAFGSFWKKYERRVFEKIVYQQFSSNIQSKSIQMIGNEAFFFNNWWGNQFGDGEKHQKWSPTRLLKNACFFC